MDKNMKVYVAGQSGMVGSALVRTLKRQGYENIIAPGHNDLDLTDSSSTMTFFRTARPDAVFVAAGKVGGIQANRTMMADFAMENLLIACNVIRAAHETQTKKLLYLGSGCIYPPPPPCQNYDKPINEEMLLSGAFEPTNEGYALAKTAGIKLCDYYRRQYGDDFISCIPANLYGENDNFDLAEAHVIPALMRRMHEAKIQNIPFVEIWGSGRPEREFLHVDDAAEGCLVLMDKYSGEGAINIGMGETLSIVELARLIKNAVGYGGDIVFDETKPDGMRKRLLDSSKIMSMGWTPKISLTDGLAQTYDWYVKGCEKCQP